MVYSITWGQTLWLTEANVARLPEASGVYLLCQRGEVIYVGQSGDLRERLGSHFRGSHSACVARSVRKGGVYFQYALVSGIADRIRIERELIERYDPECSSQ